MTYGEVCLSWKKDSVTLDDISNFRNAKISPSGAHLLYTNKPNSVILFDLETKEKTEFANYNPLDSFLKLQIETHGFSKTGSLAWSLFQGNLMKVRNFIENTTAVLPFLPEGEMLSHQAMSKDRSQIISFSFSKDFIEKGKRLEEENKALSRAEAEKREWELIEQATVNVNILNMESFELANSSIALQTVSRCAVFRDDTNLVMVRDDGSIYIKDYFSKPAQAPLELFDPIEGIKIISETMTLESNSLVNCAFLDGNTVLIKDKKEHFILRRIKEREQYIIKSDELANLHVKSFYSKFYYPFLVTRSETRTWAYHIPSGQTQTLPEHYMNIGKGGQFAIELVGSETERKAYIKAVHRPFDSSQKRILLELDLSEQKHISFNEDKSLSFIGTAFGDLFIVNGETGHIKRYFFGEQFRNLKISDSGSTFLLEYIKNERGAVEWSYKVHQIQEKCIEPVSSFSGNLESRLRELAKQEDPVEDSLLAVLTGILHEEKTVKKYSELIQPLLWKIFLHHPLIFLDLHFHYSNLKFLPPFPSALVENEKTQSQVREALISLLDSQVQFRHTKLFHWNFVSMLQPLLPTLEDKEQDFYIEKITESLSNGATKSIALFQDVFQSKLFYVIYSHVKALFGKDYEPVSDITVVRRKNSFQTVILSSEPIQNHSSIETAFGIHYATVEKLSMALDIRETKAGEELVSDFVEWSLSKGPSYRAHLQINVQDKYLEPSVKATQKLGPDYESVWQDQKMTGLVVIGSSLRSFSKTLLENYLSYFEDQGFQFSPLSVPDFQPFLKEKIEECELDYFLKESHSDGDERNVFRFDRFNSVLKGVRQTEERQIEVLYLAFPKPFHFGDRETVLFSNLELAELIKQREQKGCGEITYFNTSCWSHVKARYEIETVNSPLFLNIPSKSLSDTFLNQEGDAIRELIHAYRNRFNFDGFRKSLEKNEGYQSGKVNQYIFPDERQYYNSIFQHIEIPLKIQIDLERKKAGEWMLSINPDEAL